MNAPQPVPPELSPDGLWRWDGATWIPVPGQVPFASPLSQRPLNGLAVASLVLGTFGGVVFSVVLGLLALRRTRRLTQRGTGLAIAGLVLSAVWVAAAAAAVALHFGHSPVRDTTGVIARQGRLPYVALRVQDCAELPPVISPRVTMVTVRPCSAPHNAQVIRILRSTFPDFPGETPMRAAALADCRAAAAAFLGVDHFSLHFVAYFPTRDQWDRGDRTEQCLLVNRQAEITGDIRYQG
ncbi:MAG: DUF4190 domain-containing protein [Actinomycetota bacterium]|nr:DUF4190 domain-containing protein [Actinomycetota bacterium]